MAATNENESAMPTMRIRRAFISSLVRRFSGFIGIFFLVVRLLWWCRSFRVHDRRNYSTLGMSEGLGKAAISSSVNSLSIVSPVIAS